MNFSDNTTKIMLAIIAIFAVGLIAIKIVKTKNSHNRKTINQNRNTTGGGDIIGGNKTTNK